METFEIRNLSFSYPNENKRALENITLTIKQGEFLVLCGPSGCGKSTLLRQLKPSLSSYGEKLGEILFEGVPTEDLDRRTESSKIGFVMQSVENQIVTDKVWHELSFGLESLGFDTPTIRRKVAEMASFFGIESWFYKNVSELSGGQKQLLNLASVMVMQPSVLILDEPTSQLDPIAASDFLSTLGRINRELGTTVIITEHRLDDALALSSRAAVLDAGKLLFVGEPSKVGEELKRLNHPMFLSMPSPMRIWAGVENEFKCPVTVREGRTWLKDFSSLHEVHALYTDNDHWHGETVLAMSDVWFKYEKESADVLKGLNLELHKGEFLAILGGNGTGKSTALSVMTGLKTPYRGTVSHNGKIAMLSQNPQVLFVKKTVFEDLSETAGQAFVSNERFEEVVKLCRLGALLNRHPYDLSGGEQQRAALAKILLLNPDILLLDEPTKGLDADFKEEFSDIIKSLIIQGKSIIMVSHDIEFCARFAHRCALFFDGNIVTSDMPRKFFSGNSFYTTSANRMSRDILPEAITAEDVILSCGGIIPDRKSNIDGTFPLESTKEIKTKKKMPLWRKITAIFSAMAAAVMFIISVKCADMSSLIGPEGLTPLSGKYIVIYSVLISSLFLLAFSLYEKRAPKPLKTKEKKRLPKRTVAAAVMILLLIPLTLFIGINCFEGRGYYFTALIILIEAMLPFILIFEGRKPKARELVIIASLCAIGVAGRAALFMLPNFKPVMALTIIAGAAFGGEAGFFVGAVTMLVSNIMFSQGPWTPWQMFSMGIIGFLAGVLVNRNILKQNRVSLSIFGALCAIIIYGGIMNPASALMWQESINPQIILAYYLSGFPVDLIHAAATAFFLWFGAEPMLEKLERIKIKYGLIIQ